MPTVDPEAGGTGRSKGSIVEARGDVDREGVVGAIEFSFFVRLVGLRRTTGVVVHLEENQTVEFSEHSNGVDEATGRFKLTRSLSRRSADSLLGSGGRAHVFAARADGAEGRCQFGWFEQHREEELTLQ
jgi:hypothetical protein